jgi:formiminotetrahydrofolate cyclodeaminase
MSLEKFDTVIAISGAVTAAVTGLGGWLLGKRRQNAEVDQLVTTSMERIAKIQEQLYESAKKNWDEEKQHRISCEDKVKSLQEQINEMSKRIKE